jgi:uncharacterized protein YecE (DUF72 family)
MQGGIMAQQLPVWIGTSGYSYTDWVGPFYPPGTRSGKMLSQYCRYFPLVELNFSFYRLPTATMLARLAEQTPEGFQFIVKMPQSLSHEEKTEELLPFRQAVAELQRRQRLSGVLCQLPQATHDTPGHRRWLELMGREFAGYQLAVEFRHRSWFNPEVPPWLAEQQTDLVAVDAPDLPNLYPSGLVQSGPRVYVRFHSRNDHNWYLSDKDRYDYDYSDAALTEWIESLNRHAGRTDRAMLLFNNCRRSQAAENAQRIAELLERLAPQLTVVQPFAIPRSESQQRLLFD